MRLKNPDSYLPPGVSIERGLDGKDETIDAIHCWGGTFEVRHLLPPDIETPLLLQASGGLGTAAVAECLSVKEPVIAVCLREGYDAFETPKLGRGHHRIYAALGRYCLSDSLLNLVKPTPPQSSDRTSLKMLSLLGRGQNWAEAARAVGYSQRFAMQYVKENYARVLGDEKLNVISLLLYSYGARHLDPVETVTAQTGELPQLPLLKSNVERSTHKINRLMYGPAYAEPKLPLRRSMYLNNNEKDPFPQPFRPFEDEDKLIWFAKGEIVEIEACGVALSVDDKSIIAGLNGEQVKLSAKAKLSLLLTAMGASTEDVVAYGMDPGRFMSLLKRLGIKRGSGMHQLTKTTLLVCRELLEPISKQSRHTVRTKIKQANYQLRREEAPSWSRLNLQLLLSYASGQINPDELLQIAPPM